MINGYEQRKQKWEQKQAGFKVNSAREATFILTVQNVLKLLGERRSGRLLDIGCGFGEIDIILAKNSDFQITGIDISKKAVDTAKDNVARAGLDSRIRIEEGDAYNLKYPDSHFDVVASFGYASAASYRGAQKEIARVLKPGGILICDFINCLSLYKIFNSFLRVLKRSAPYYISLSGIEREFRSSGFTLRGQKLFNTYPPLNLGIPTGFFLIFENTLGKLLRKLLARVRLVCFSFTPR